ncbi:hypothetical protein [Nocardia brasiliensis]|uniref:hypothetical protein n=1 Tax=Nocardia brasiliensis TaxID=37326 RepID=UPI00245800B1|nr:hypothetical protein [Nocardia brasiliensis]
MTSITGFTRGNGSTNPAMSGGVASVSGTTDGVYPARWDTPCLSDYMYAQAELNVNDTGQAAQVFVRCSESGFSQRVAFGAATSGLYIFTYTTGNNNGTQRANVAHTSNAGDLLRLEARGNVYYGYVNGTLELTWTDSGNVVSIGQGFRGCGLIVVRGSFVNSASLREFEAGDL